MRFAALALLFASVTFAAPPDKPAEPLYFPTKVGDKKIYEMKSKKGVSEFVETVTKIEEKDGRLFVTSEHFEDKKPAGFTTHEVTPKRLVINGKEVTGKGMPLLKLPAKKGDTWEHTLENDASLKFMLTVLKTDEEIEVPAGKFKTICVESVLPDVKMRQVQWHAPNIGIVKQTIAFGESVSVVTLKSFTPGK